MCSVWWISDSQSFPEIFIHSECLKCLSDDSLRPSSQTVLPCAFFFTSLAALCAEGTEHSLPLSSLLIYPFVEVSLAVQVQVGRFQRCGFFGFFDPHCRTPDGLTAAEHMGTAVMLTFANLEDLIDRLLILYQACLKLSDGQQYDLLPVSFENRDTATTADTQGIK
ncbi:hypothetical protein MHYP_G00018230 [Metynnis hypsauchen]